MKKHLLLVFDAPLMSFGGAVIDQNGPTMMAPGLAMLAGLLGNAIGYAHGDTEKLESLQNRLVFGARRERRGEIVTDYQTVSLGQDSLLDDKAWTTTGRLDERSGASSTGTLIRYREYLADALFSVVLRLEPAEESPTLEQLETALKSPVRPLFLGRKNCLPASPILQGRFDAPDILTALKNASRPRRVQNDSEAQLWWPRGEGESPLAIESAIVDRRDWLAQTHGGRRFVLSALHRFDEVAQ